MDFYKATFPLAFKAVPSDVLRIVVAAQNIANLEAVLVVNALLLVDMTSPPRYILRMNGEIVTVCRSITICSVGSCNCPSSSLCCRRQRHASNVNMPGRLHAVES